MTDKTDAEKAVSEGPVQPKYFVGDRLMHNDGHIGVMVLSGYSLPDDPDYGKKYLVRPERAREIWKTSDLDKKFALSINQTVQKLDGTKGSLAGFVEGGVMVWPYREEKDEVWKPEDIAGFAMAIIQERAVEQTVANYQGEIDDLQRQLDFQLAANEKLASTPTPALPQSMGQGEDPGPSPLPHGGEKIQIKTLVQEFDLVNQKYGDGDLEGYLDAGWEVLDCTVVTRPDVRCAIVRVVTLKREKLPTLPENGAKKVEISQVLPPFSVDDLHSEPVKITWNTIYEPGEDDEPDDDPETDPAARREGNAFAEALRDPDVPVWQLKEIGNKQAFERGQAVFERGRKARSLPVPMLPVTE